MKKTFIFLACLMFLGFYQNLSFAAPFQNGTFDTNFNGWLGELHAADLNGDIIAHYDLDPNAPSFTLDAEGDGTPENYQNNYFSIDNHQAKLTNDETFFDVVLYQDFDMETLSPGWTMDISFWIKWTPTNSDQDSLSAILTDNNNSSNQLALLASISTNDLTDGVNVVVDVTSFAGKNVDLAFSLLDYDFDTRDKLLIDNITFNKHSASVPEPATMFLVGIGFLPLCLFRKK